MKRFQTQQTQKTLTSKARGVDMSTPVVHGGGAI